MPQLEKGGKYVFGWARIKENGEVVIPDEAVLEYRLKTDDKIILISGSRTSGGFSISNKTLLECSAISSLLTDNPELAGFQNREGETVKYKNRVICWVNLHENKTFILPLTTMKAYGVKPGDYLLAARGSDKGIGMAAKGPLIEIARLHSEIKIF